MRTFIGLVLLCAAIGGVYVLNERIRSPEGKSLLHVARELEINVEVAAPEQREIVRTVQAPGEVEPFSEVDISSEVVGKIIELPVKEGETVTKGQLLCRLDDVEYRAAVVSREANVSKLAALITQAEADLEKAERDYGRQVAFMETEVTSANEVANYRTVLIGARALLDVRRNELIEARAALDSARENLAKTVITSPIDGIVSQLFAEAGEVVITGTMNNLGTRIMVISDLSVMQVRCRVDETDAPLVAADQTARIYLQSDTRRSVPGSVLRVGSKGVKPAGRDVVTFETLVLVTGDDSRVMPGMSANVDIEVARRPDALTVPVQAVVYRKRRDVPEALLKQHDEAQAQLDPEARQGEAEYIKMLFCVRDGKAEARLVQTGISDATRVEVLEGLSPGETVVIGPYRSLDQLKADALVKIDNPDAVAAPATASAPAGDSLQQAKAP